MATTPATVESTAAVLASELAAVWGEKSGGKSELKPSARSADAGWLVVVPVEGGPQGRAAAWFESKGAAAAAESALKADADPKDDDVSKWLCEIVLKSVQTFLMKTGQTSAKAAAAAASQSPAPEGASAFEVVVAGKGCKLATHLALATANAAVSEPSSSQRLEAVLDVDLPLVVRFGRATMPLRALAVLGPGSVIDMGRSPDEPVELLVGDRLIARGEVVVVGGNYGVRITDMTGSQPFSSELEARTS